MPSPEQATAPVDPALLPSPFGPDELWVFCAREPRHGRTLEGLILADAGAPGLSQIHQAFPANGVGHELVFAFALPHLHRLRQALDGEHQATGVLDAQAMGVARPWPRWFSPAPSTYAVWILEAGQPQAVWVRARTQGEAALCVAQAHPCARVLTMGALEDLHAHIGRLEAAVAAQDYGALFADLRQAAPRPATAAHIAGYPLAAMGLYASPQAAMAAHQALFLADDQDAHTQDDDALDHIG